MTLFIIDAIHNAVVINTYVNINGPKNIYIKVFCARNLEFFYYEVFVWKHLKLWMWISKKLMFGNLI